MASVQSGDGEGDAQHLSDKPAMQRKKGTSEGNGNKELRAAPGDAAPKARLVS